MTRIIRFKMRYARSKMRYAVLVKYLFEKNIHDVLMIFASPSKTQHHAHDARDKNDAIGDGCHDAKTPPNHAVSTTQRHFSQSPKRQTIMQHLIGT